MKVATVVLRDCDLSLVKGDVIGVDKGALLCLEAGIPMKMACGDFDSISTQALEDITAVTKRVDILNPIKDETDFSYALSCLDDYEIIYILGALGGRKDHEYLIIRTVMHDTRLKVVDAYNEIYSLDKGTHKVEKGDYTYLSIFPNIASIITLEGFKYPLTTFNTYGHEDMLTSNEITDISGIIVIDEGSILVIQSKD